MNRHINLLLDSNNLKTVNSKQVL